MLTIQRSGSLRRAEGCNLPGTHLLPPVGTGASVSGWKPAERSVSFNRDVHVKRIDGWKTTTRSDFDDNAANLRSDQIARDAGSNVKVDTRSTREWTGIMSQQYRDHILDTSHVNRYH
ncbi:hypothetical protein EAG_09530 [Camponotus floridanus]|uniref:Uncharacterized protein n=1 Tax=Camponotus floridanus TaxID=104421 RepID=E1ZZ97_CAMFO|nr:hypothetical protein EAG_09530 [Camponotus floridanus]